FLIISVDTAGFPNESREYCRLRVRKSLSTVFYLQYRINSKKERNEITGMVNQSTGKRRKKTLNDIVPINTAVSTAASEDTAPEPRGMELSAVRPQQKSTSGLRGIAAAKPNAAETAHAAGIFRPKKAAAGLLHLSGADTGNHSNGANSPNSVGINAVGGNAVDNSENSGGTDGGNGNSGNDSSSDSFEDYYTRLLETLHGYGVALTLPTLEELYSQL
ncbi:MAG TPA: hypothetical protein DCY17_01950, partial [Clostridiales bacterium]|nr:hypothetical protein [Clostridiales bacterium]